MKYFRPSAKIIPEIVTTQQISENIIELYENLKQKSHPGFGEIISSTLEKTFSQRDNENNNSLILLLEASEILRQPNRESSRYNILDEENQIPQLDQKHHTDTIHPETKEKLDEYLEALYCIVGATSKTGDNVHQKEILNSVNHRGQTPLLLALRNAANQPEEPRHQQALEIILSCQNLDIAHSLFCLADKRPEDSKTFTKLLGLYEEREDGIDQNFKQRNTAIVKKQEQALALSQETTRIDKQTNPKAETNLKESSELSKQAAYEIHNLSSDIAKYQRLERKHEHLAALTYSMRGNNDASHKLLESRHFTNNMNRNDKYKLMKYLVEDCDSRIKLKENPYLYLRNIDSLAHSELKNDIEMQYPENFHKHFIQDNKEMSESFTMNISSVEPQILARLCLNQYDDWEKRLELILELDSLYQADQNVSSELGLKLTDFDEKSESQTSQRLDMELIQLTSSITEEVREVVNKLRGVNITPSQFLERPQGRQGQRNKDNNQTIL